MYGVILWVDDACENALIWCEDHGDLAYYRRKDDTVETEAEFDTGDMIRFEVMDRSQVRGARNIALVEVGHTRALDTHLACAANDDRFTPVRRRSALRAV